MDQVASGVVAAVCDPWGHASRCSPRRTQDQRFHPHASQGPWHAGIGRVLGSWRPLQSQLLLEAELVDHQVCGQHLAKHRKVALFHQTNHLVVPQKEAACPDQVAACHRQAVSGHQMVAFLKVVVYLSHQEVACNHLRTVVVEVGSGHHQTRAEVCRTVDDQKQGVYVDRSPYRP